MRSFFSAHWKAVVALIVLVLLAVVTMSPGAASAGLDARLRQHVTAIAAHEYDTSNAAGQQRAARYIEALLASEGYAIRRQEYRAGDVTVRDIEASVANVAQGERPARIFIVGAHYDSVPGTADDSASGAAAVLELARLLTGMHPSPGTELRFVFHEGRQSDTGNFIAFAGARSAMRLVSEALAGFRAGPDVPEHGLAAPAYAQGVTLSAPAAYNGHGYTALMVTDTAFLRYPYHPTAGDTAVDLDYQALARVVRGLAHTIAALAGTTSS